MASELRTKAWKTNLKVPGGDVAGNPCFAQRLLSVLIRRICVISVSITFASN